jgi:hypothetical protein
MDTVTHFHEGAKKQLTSDLVHGPDSLCMQFLAMHKRAVF